MYDVNDKKSAVRAVQTYLLELHFGEGAIPFLRIDGIYGERTRSAVRAFQRSASLEESGVVDFSTFEALYAAYCRKRKERESSRFLPPDTRFPVTIGRRGDGVRNLQHLLNALAERYSIAMSCPEDGVYSYATETLSDALRTIYREEDSNGISGCFFDKMVRDFHAPRGKLE